jgi:hypothetical protein
VRAIAAVIGLAVACAVGILGPLAFSAHEKPQPQAQATAAGDLVYRSGSYAVRLTDQPCEFDEIEVDLSDRGVPPVKAYQTLQRDGRWNMSGCWAKTMGREVLTRDTAGADGYIPSDWFKREGR